MRESVNFFMEASCRAQKTVMVYSMTRYTLPFLTLDETYSKTNTSGRTVNAKTASRLQFTINDMRRQQLGA